MLGYYVAISFIAGVVVGAVGASIWWILVL